MMPDNVLSSQTVRGNIVGARALAVTPIVDYEDGGVALNDSTRGNQYQIWQALLIKDQVLISAPNTPEFVMFAGPGLTEISLTFDQNMRPVLAFMQSGVARYRWYDPTVGAQIVTDLPAGSITPKVILDDKRQTQTSNCDVILAYVRAGGLYYRQQRDRYQIERLLTDGVTTSLLRIGFSDQLRLQFMMEVAR
ncbi:hypothetical protein [Pseudomonas sp.]|uniref:hypothetical protein n=1 Tax=Pseudomonas sp. TaxID=306 RepID=UPI003FD7B886